jgi:hypothetical protein
VWRKRWGVGLSENGPASLKTLARFSRQRSEIARMFFACPARKIPCIELLAGLVHPKEYIISLESFNYVEC